MMIALRRRATVEFSPAFQGWDHTLTHNFFVASATVEMFNRRCRDEIENPSRDPGLKRPG